MKLEQVNPDAVRQALQGLPRHFDTYALSDSTLMIDAHRAVTTKAYHATIGRYLSTHEKELGLRRTSPDGQSPAEWEQIGVGSNRSQQSEGPTHVRPPTAPPPTTSAARATPGAEEGLAYSTGPGFRARAEAHQRRFRADVLRAGWTGYGHHLDEQAAQAGANFLHPEALASVQKRSLSGKGVHLGRTLGNMLSSQALCFNIFGPLQSEQGGLELAGQVLSGFVPGLATVLSIDIEYTPSAEVFGDQFGRGGVDCDVRMDFSDREGQRGVLVIETKFVEDSFSCCGHCKPGAGDPCPSDVRIGADFQGCRYVRKNRYRYWQRATEAGSLRLPFGQEVGCPFRGPLWQVWVNHTLAHAEAKSRGASHAVFAVCAPAENEALLANGPVLEKFRDLVTDPSTVVFIPLEQLLSRLHELAGSRSAVWGQWPELLRTRYTVPTATSSPGVRPTEGCPRHAPVTEGHWAIVQWMGTPDFRQTVANHRAACRGAAEIYFRATDKGLVRIVLHPKAPGYVGFHRDADDECHVLQPGANPPAIEDIAAHLRDFETWLQTVRRCSEEERGVIPWLRDALTGQLQLPSLGAGWVFLCQEWRFRDDANKGKKSDILAVHATTGQLGIVEFKSDVGKLAEARTQVDEYARYWHRDAAELAPFFTKLLRAMGTAYGNHEVVQTTVSTAKAALFVGVANPQSAVKVWQR